MGINNKVNLKSTPIVSLKTVSNAAIIVSGSLRNFFLSSSLKHLIKPLSNQGHTVDYWLALSTDLPTYKENENSYLNALKFDPLINEAVHVSGIPKVRNIIKRLMNNFGGHARRVIIPESIDIDSNKLVRKKKMQAIKKNPKEHPFLRFPIRDLRKEEK